MSCLTSSAFPFAGRGSWILHYQKKWPETPSVALITQSVEEIEEEDSSHLPIPKLSATGGHVFAAVEPKPIHIDKRELREKALEGRRKRPIRENQSVIFRRETNKDYKELIINTEALERRVAMMENGILQGFDVERLDEDRMVGAIFKGKVQNLEAGLKAAFVDIGQEKNAFLHYWDMLPGANNDPSIEIVRENRSKKSKGTEPKSVKDIPGFSGRFRDRGPDHQGSNREQRTPHHHQPCPFPGAFLFSCRMRANAASRARSKTSSRRARLKSIIGNLPCVRAWA